MKVRVPAGIAGGSLLKAHRWVKSSIAKNNPHGSTDNYKIQSISGMPLSLSDLTTQSFDEVFLLAGPRSNPGKVYPFPQDTNYPTYDSKRIVGNDYAALLGKDVDASMVERLIAQNGVFSGLNTLTKLLYTIDSAHQSASDPDVAAIIQSYANAQQKRGIRSNPGRPFFARGVNDQYRGVLSPEEAVKTFVEEKYGVSPGQHSMPFTSAIDKARIVRMYGLQDDNNVKQFVDNVLGPYLAVSIPNANFLKALRSQDYYGEMQKYTMKLRGENKTSNVEDSLMWKKLVSLTPMSSKDFYEGKDFAFVVNPYFSRSGLGQAMLTKKHVAELMKIVEDHPKGALKEVNTGFRKETNLLSKFVSMLTGSDRQIAWKAATSQGKILAEGDNPQEILANLKAIYETETDEDDLAKAFEKIPLLSKEEELGILEYRSNVGGFRPTAPPFWPKPVVLSIMDVLRDNINLLVSNGSFNAGQAFLDLAHTEPQERTMIKIPNKLPDDGTSFNVPFGYLKFLVNKFVDLQVTDVKDLFSDNIKDDRKVRDVGLDKLDDMTMAERRKSADEVFSGGAAAKKQIRAIIKHLIADRNSDFLDNLNPERMLDEDAKKLQAIAKQALHYHKGKISSQEIEGNTNVLGLLSIFMETEETARNKYDYTMTENDRAFALFLIEMVFKTISEDVAEASIEADDPGPDELKRMAQLVAQMTSEDEKLEPEVIENRINFEIHMKKIGAAANALLELHDNVSSSSVKSLITKETGIGESDEKLPGWANKRYNDMVGAISSDGTDDLDTLGEAPQVKRLVNLCYEYKTWINELKAKTGGRPLGAPYLADPEALKKAIAGMKDVKVVFDGGARISKDLDEQTDFILREVREVANDTIRQMQELYRIMSLVRQRRGDLGSLNTEDLFKGTKKESDIQLQKIREHNLKYASLANRLRVVSGHLQGLGQQLDSSQSMLELQMNMRRVSFDNIDDKTNIRRFKHLITNYKANINGLQREIDAAIREIEDSTRMMNRNELSFARYPYLDSEETKRFDAAYWRITNKLLHMMPKAYDVHKAAEPVSNFSRTGAHGTPLSAGIRPQEADLTVKRISHKARYLDIAKQIEDTFGDSAYNKQDFFSVSVEFIKSLSFADSRYADGRLMARTLAEQIMQAMSGVELGDVKPVEEGWEEYEQLMLDAEDARALVRHESRERELEGRETIMTGLERSVKAQSDILSEEMKLLEDSKKYQRQDEKDLDKRKKRLWKEEEAFERRVEREVKRRMRKERREARREARRKKPPEDVPEDVPEEES